MAMDSFKRRQEGPQGAFMPHANNNNGFPHPQANSAAFGGGKRQRLGPMGQGAEGEQGGAEGGAKLLPVCLLVSENTAGALIGKGGNTVREFERSTGTKILIQRNTLGPQELAAAKQAAAETVGAPQQTVDVDKVVAVAGNKEEEVQAGVLRILGLISSHPGHSGRTVILLLVPHRSVGGIVGQRGKTIEDLSQRSQARIRVVPGMAAPNGDRALCISGQTDEQVAMAIQLVQQHLQQMFANGRLSQGDVEFLISLASVPQPKALRGVKGPLPMGAPMPGGLPVGNAPAMPGGYYGPGGGWGAAPGAPPVPGGPQPGGPVTPQPAPGASARGPGVSGCRFVTSVEACGGLGCTSVLCLVVPKKLAAWIVGPQGSHVRGVRDDTGAQLQVVDEVLGFTAADASRVGRGPHGGPQGAPAETMEPSDRFCMISGGVQSLCAAILRLCLPLDEKLQHLHQPLRMLIPTRFVTCLIGSKGSVIREMQGSSGATIQISKGPAGAPDGASAREQHRIVFIEGPPAARMVALALIWQRILGVEYPDLTRGGAPFIDVPSLVEDLQQQGQDISMVRVPPSAAIAPPMQQQEPPYGGEQPVPYYDGAPVPGAGWGPPPPDAMAGPPPAWGGEEGGWGGPKEGAPTYEQMEGYFRDFCSRFVSPHELAACGERQTIKLLLSQAQGEALLRREQPRFGGPPPASPPPNALDKISELTGCHVRCFVTQEPVPQGAHGAPPPQQQMVLVFTGVPIANSLAVMLTQARLVQS